MHLMKTLIHSAAVLAFSVGAAAAQTVSIATLPQGSVWNTMGNVIAGAVREHGNVRMVVQPYGGNLAMMQAVNQGLAEFSINDVNDVIVAFAGEVDYRDNAQSGLRIVAKLNALPVGLYVRESLGIERIEELKGKRVSSGWDAFPLAKSHVSAILTAGGLTYDDVVGVPVPGLIRGSDDLVSGRTDAAFFAVGGPKVAEVDAAVEGVRFLKIESDASALEAHSGRAPGLLLFGSDAGPVSGRDRGADDDGHLGQRPGGRRPRTGRNRSCPSDGDG